MALHALGAGCEVARGEVIAVAAASRPNELHQVGSVQLCALTEGNLQLLQDVGRGGRGGEAPVVLSFLQMETPEAWKEWN